MNFHDPRSWIAFGRGLFFEILTYASAKLTKLFFTKRTYGAAVVTGITALWCILVSAGNNLGWVINGGDFVGVFASMGHLMPPVFMFFYEAGLGLLLPLSVGALALVDISHLVHEALENASMDNSALQVAESEMHRTEYLRSQNKQRKQIRNRYDGIAEKRADAYVKKVESGDLSFGASEQKGTGTSAARVISGPGAGRPALPSPQPGGQSLTVPGQVSPATHPSTGNTQTINIPSAPVPSPSQGKPGLFGRKRSF
jgi:hypothetical protein